MAHNRYRSAAPSGENRVVDRRAEALAALGHDVIRFERHSDDIEQWSRAKKAALPGRAVWSVRRYRDLAGELRAHRPDVVHVHNTFPLLSAAVLHACRDARVPWWPRSTTTSWPAPAANSSAPARCVTTVRAGCPARRSCTAVTGDRARPRFPSPWPRAVHRPAWRSLVSAYIFISASQRDLLPGLSLPPDRVFVRHNLIPPQAARREARTATVIYAGRLDDGQGRCAC